MKLEEIKKVALKGDPEAQFKLGAAYQKGEGVEEDQAQAIHWFRLSAEQGHAGAQSNLGVIYHRGEGVEQDNEQAIHWFRLAAEQGNAVGQNNLGVSYYLGEGVEQDYEQAVHWTRLAAEQGLAQAQSALGSSYAEGEGVEQDYELAVHWARLAAEQGDAESQNNLGVSYYLGEGVEQDYEQAVHWTRLAAEQGDTNAQKNLGFMYHSGAGVEQDDEQAIHWFGLAGAELGVSAIDLLDEYVASFEAQEDTAEVINFPVSKRALFLNKLLKGREVEILKGSIEKEIREELEARLRGEILAELKAEMYNIKPDNPSIAQLITSDEKDIIEYKETFSFDVKTKQSESQILKHAVIREVAAFLNSRGGHILIGVSDSKNVKGIEEDDFKDRESYVRKITQAIESGLGTAAASLTNIEIEEYKGKQICVIKCAKSKTAVYCNYKKSKNEKPKDEIFVRIGNVTTQPPPKEWVDYHKHHFG